MTALLWDQVGEHVYETGVDHGVLYIPDGSGVYNNGVAWNGLTNVTESPSGAEANAQYADNIKYLNLYSAEEFGATIEAFTYPEEFNQFDGVKTPSPGVYVGQQKRLPFGFSYRTLIGNDTEATAYGYKIHMVWGATATPSEKAYGTVNDSPEPINFSWEIATLPLTVGDDMDPTSLIVIDSTKVDADALAALEEILYGGVSTDPSLPAPADVVALFGGDALATNVVVSGDVDSIDITGTTTNYLFRVEQWDGDNFNVVVGGDGVNEAAAEALTLSNGVTRVTLLAAGGYYVPAAQQSEFNVIVT